MVPLGSIKLVWKSLCFSFIYLFILERFLVLSLPAEHNSSFCLHILASSLLVPAGSGKCTSKWNWTITRTKRGRNNKIKSHRGFICCAVCLSPEVGLDPANCSPVRKFMPVGTPAEFKVTHMNNWLQGLGHSLQFLFQDKFIIIRSHLALKQVAGLGTSRSNGYLIFFNFFYFYCCRKNKQLATSDGDLIIIMRGKKKKALPLFCWGKFLSEWWALNILFNKSSCPRGRRRAQEELYVLQMYKWYYSWHKAWSFRALLLYLLPYNFPEVIHLQIYIEGNWSNIKKLSNSWSRY